MKVITEFSFPFLPISVNNAYPPKAEYIKGKWIVTKKLSPAAATQKNEMRMLANAAKNRLRGSYPELTKDLFVIVDIWLFMDDLAWSKRDADNCEKTCLDSMEYVYYLKDLFVCDVYTHKRESPVQRTKMQRRARWRCNKTVVRIMLPDPDWRKEGAKLWETR